jgi:CubicO group peptidase (beta-lactamase class C family)
MAFYILTIQLISLGATMKSKFSIFFLLIIAHLNLESSDMTDPIKLARKIDDCIQHCSNFSGAVLVAQKGTIILSKGYGFANYEHDIPNTPQTKFRIASMTKPFTAAAIMRLQEKNLLSVHDLLSKYIPDYPNGDKITLHHLLTHTSGIPNYYKHWDDVRNCSKLEDLILAFKSWQSEFEPGSNYAYSNSNYSLLAYIIEKQDLR